MVNAVNSQTDIKQFKEISGLTFVELIIIITILAILSALITPNFINSLKKGRDARRKSDLNQIQKALEMYYEDNNTYPLTSMISFGEGNKICHPRGCDTKIYMESVPNDPISNYTYVYQSNDGSSYKLYSCIENSQDQGPGVKQSGYDPSCGNCGKCKFGLSSPNTNP